MRNINFIRPVPEYRYKEFRRWALGSGLFIVGGLLAIASISFMQWRIYHAVAQEKRELAEKLISYDQIMNQQRSKSMEEKSLLEKLGKLDAYTHNPKNPIDIITTVQKTLGSAPLQSLSISADNFELKGHCTHATYATELARKLNKLPLCKQASLSSISTHNNNLHFVIKGLLV